MTLARVTVTREDERMARRRDEQNAAIQAAVVSAAKAIAEPAAFLKGCLAALSTC